MFATLILVYVTMLCAWYAPSSGFVATKASIKPQTRNLFSVSSMASTGYSLGAPHLRPRDGSYITEGKVKVDFTVETILDVQTEINSMIDTIDNHHGVLLTSSYEYPGRYSRWTVGFVAPALQIESIGMNFVIKPLNGRGKVIAHIIHSHFIGLSIDAFPCAITYNSDDGTIRGVIKPSDKYFTEEERSKQASVFSVIREINSIFAQDNAGQLGLYGSFGYDLTFQFESINMKKNRDPRQRDLVLYFPDEILIVDNQKSDAWRIKYDFTSCNNPSLSTVGIERKLASAPYQQVVDKPFEPRDYPRGDYAEQVQAAKEEFRVGNLFEVVLSQSFRNRLKKQPSDIFRRLCKRNPSPYGFFMNLGDNEYLVGASPEMFVRVETTTKGLRVETCPISGTIERGGDALEDAQQIKKLLLSAKEESELTMCTDVDRNDKSRICQFGSVQVIGRRQIELYSRLIHTVDHVEGYLRPGFDSLDAFLCHTWAVTVTGAPKTWAIRFIEEKDKSARKWYGGAVGMVGFDGSLNTGLTLRTIQISDGIAEVRAGATLLFDSDAQAEEDETELKASALIDALTKDDEIGTDFLSNIRKPNSNNNNNNDHNSRLAPKVLLIDHEDSFVHTLANYVRQTGAEVVTCRSGPNFKVFVRDMIQSGKFVPDLAVLSPGPGSPSDFDLSGTIQSLIDLRVPIFGVCLGLQGLTEFFGGSLGVLDYPMHGKPSLIKQSSSSSSDREEEEEASSVNNSQVNILDGLPEEFQVARYHSLHAKIETLPKELQVIASSGDGVVMALQHTSMPIAAVQFHPESILTLPKYGLKIVANALHLLKSNQYK